MNILTWNEKEGSGALQVSTVYGSDFSDLINVKPTFSFDFTNFEYIEINGSFKVDGRPMTEDQKNEIRSELGKVVPPENWVKLVKSAASEQYLKDTDWYVLRLIETGKAIPQEIRDNRKSHRNFISNIKNNIETKVEAL